MASGQWVLNDTVIFELSKETPIPMSTGGGGGGGGGGGKGKGRDRMEVDDEANSSVFVTEATWNGEGDLFCVSGSNGDIKIYSWSSDRGPSLSCRMSHGDSAPAIRFDKANKNLLWSCGNNGEVRMWDLRTSAAEATFKAPKKHRTLLCCDVNADNTLLAAGTALVSEEAKIIFW